MEAQVTVAKDWQPFTDGIAESTPVNAGETQEAKLSRITMLEADPEAWFRYYFPKYYYADPANFHKAATRRILENPEWYEVRLWSRELAKSTRTMMEVFYIAFVGHSTTPPAPQGQAAAPEAAPRALSEGEGGVAHTDAALMKVPDSIIRPAHNILLISNSADNAERLIAPYKANLEANRRLINDYGVQKNFGSWEATEFITQSRNAFRAIGAGQSPRGTRNGEVRPDIIIFDDLDTDEDCRNPELVQHRWNWIEEAAIPTRSISKPTTVIFCGNRIATDCCIQRATRYADYVDEVNIRDADGNSTWAKNTEEHIDRLFSKISYAAMQKEYYNNPLHEGSVFKAMAYKPARPLYEYNLLVCYTDPSYKESKKNDYKATVLVGRWNDEFHIIKAYVFQGTTAQMIDAHYEIMDVVGNCACYYYIEQVFLQDMFLKEFHAAAAATGRTIPIAGDSRSKADKYVRIESLLEPLNRNGKLYLNEAEKENPGMKNLEQQFLAFGPGSRAHDDAPDAVEGAIWKINNKPVTRHINPCTGDTYHQRGDDIIAVARRKRY